MNSTYPLWLISAQGRTSDVNEVTERRTTSCVSLVCYEGG